MANMMINGDPFLQERAFTKEEKKVEKTAEKRLNSAITLLIIGCRCLTNALPQFHAVKREVENKWGTPVITKDSCSSPPVKKHFVVKIQVP